MRADVLDEPELEFGGGIRHIDPRFGISNYGPADLGSGDAPRAIRVGLVGPAEHLEELQAWLERCREPIAAKDERYPHLFPEFPGCDTDRGLHTTLVFSQRNTRTISDRDLRAIGESSRVTALMTALDAYSGEVMALADENRVDVLLVARPDQLRDSARRKIYVAAGPLAQAAAATGAPAGESGEDPAIPRYANFHDMLKARLLQVRQPMQIIRHSTWDEATPPPAGHSRQDEATRAWNLHTALYYKAGGVPWRLPRNSADLTVCFVGIAFYRNDDNETLDTSVAQVFNERGDGVIVRGGPARISSDDRQPHLSRDDASELLLRALDTYRREHKTLPARVVLHKTSSFTADEIDGFRSAADDRGLDSLELVWITNSEGARLFRPGDAPPLRGTMLTITDQDIALYTKGSVEFYSTYPGMYVPQPIGIRPAEPARSGRGMGSEILALTKMSWNQTRLDGRDPITIRAANQVKAILRFCTTDQAIATRYANYM